MTTCDTNLQTDKSNSLLSALLAVWTSSFDASVAPVASAMLPMRFLYLASRPQVTLPAGYLGSSFIGAALIACGFDAKASKIACLVLAGFFILTLWWARQSLL